MSENLGKSPVSKIENKAPFSMMFDTPHKTFALNFLAHEHDNPELPRGVLIFSHPGQPSLADVHRLGMELTQKAANGQGTGSNGAMMGWCGPADPSPKLVGWRLMGSVAVTLESRVFALVGCLFH